MQLEQVRKILAENGFVVKSEEALSNGTGTKLKLESGQQVNVFNTGTVNVQGKKPDAVRSLFPASSDEGSAQSPRSSKVFVVYGHDDQVRTQLEALLRRWGLDPIILDQMPSEGMTIIEKLEKLVEDVRFAVVLATPDDEGHRRGHDDEKALRARQNVVLELGMLLVKLGRQRVAILLKQEGNMERPSDIQGLIYIPFKDTVDDAKLLLAKELNAQGFSIDVGKL